jgi:hypothetical protein
VTTTQATIYQLKVTLLDTRPAVWRRLQVQANVRLSRLHRILQVLMRWTESHLHQFRIDGELYGAPTPGFDLPLINEQRVRLHQVVPGLRTTFHYEYDFGDSWEHAIAVESSTPAAHRQRHPICLDGARACPPEDVGGTEGYRQFLAAISDPRHEEHEDMLTWVGGAFDPNAFDLTVINRELARLR